jgi:hypothetical protein
MKRFVRIRPAERVPGTDRSGAPAPDYTLSASTGSPSVARGTVTVSSLSDSGFANPIGLTVTGLPAGATASFSPTSVTGVGSSVLTVTVGTSTPYGSYPLTVTGTSGPLVRTLPVTCSSPRRTSPSSSR